MAAPVSRRTSAAIASRVARYSYICPAATFANVRTKPRQVCIWWVLHGAQNLSAKHDAPTERERKRWLRFLERDGLECAPWPRLFLQRQQCMTWARLQSTSRQARGAHRSTLEERKDSLWRQGRDEEEEPPDVAGARRTYMSHVLSDILDFGASYDILHFTYDLALWTDIGSKRNLGYNAPLRLLMKGHSFSSEYWQAMHRALVDLVRQKGYPPVFSMRSPLEWSWPYHHIIVDAMAKTQRGQASVFLGRCRM